MQMSKALRNRWRRAQEYTVKQVSSTVEMYNDPAIDDLRATWRAPSSAGGQWHTHAATRQGVVVHTLCDCPDYGTVTHKEYAQCKHTLALSAYLIIATKRYSVLSGDTIQSVLNRTRKGRHNA